MVGLEQNGIHAECGHTGGSPETDEFPPGGGEERR